MFFFIITVLIFVKYISIRLLRLDNFDIQSILDKINVIQNLRPMELTFYDSIVGPCQLKSKCKGFSQ